MARRAFTLVALIGALVLTLGGIAFAQDFDSTQTGGTGGADLGPGMDVANGATGGGLEAAAIGELGDTTFDESTATPVLDLPALGVEEDAQGRIRMDLPGLTLVSGPKAQPAPPAEPEEPEGAPSKLPVTGVNVGDFAALGLAALSGGGVLLRRLRFAFAA